MMSSFVYVDEERAIQPLSKGKLQRVGYLECLHINRNMFLFVFYALIYIIYININLNLFIFINVQDMCMFFSSAFLNIL